MRPPKDGMETDFEVRCFDLNIPLGEYEKLPKNPLWFGLDNLRSAFNVGSIFRLGDILRVKGLLLCGNTAAPPHQRLRKTSMGTVDVVPWQRFDNAIDAIRHLKERNVPVWAAETTTASKPYNRIRYPRELAIVLGNEALGVNSEALRLCEEIIEIPTFGFKNSMNVASAAAVLGYKALEMMQSESGDVEKRC